MKRPQIYVIILYTCENDIRRTTQDMSTWSFIRSHLSTIVIVVISFLSVQQSPQSHTGTWATNLTLIGLTALFLITVYKAIVGFVAYTKSRFHYPDLHPASDEMQNRHPFTGARFPEPRFPEPRFPEPIITEATFTDATFTGGRYTPAKYAPGQVRWVYRS